MLFRVNLYTTMSEFGMLKKLRKLNRLILMNLVVDWTLLRSTTSESAVAGRCVIIEVQISALKTVIIQWMVPFVSGYRYKLPPLNLKSRESDPLLNVTSVQQKIDMWEERFIYGGYPEKMLLSSIDIEASTKWLTNGVLFYETEAFFTSIRAVSS